MLGTPSEQVAKDEEDGKRCGHGRDPRGRDPRGRDLPGRDPAASRAPRPGPWHPGSHKRASSARAATQLWARGARAGLCAASFLRRGLVQVNGASASFSQERFVASGVPASPSGLWGSSF